MVWVFLRKCRAVIEAAASRSYHSADDVQVFVSDNFARVVFSAALTHKNTNTHTSHICEWYSIGFLPSVKFCLGFAILWKFQIVRKLTSVKWVNTNLDIGFENDFMPVFVCVLMSAYVLIPYGYGLF